MPTVADLPTATVRGGFEPLPHAVDQSVPRRQPPDQLLIATRNMKSIHSLTPSRPVLPMDTRVRTA
jgi:hypothetical protein